MLGEYWPGPDWVRLSLEFFFCDDVLHQLSQVDSFWAMIFKHKFARISDAKTISLSMQSEELLGKRNHNAFRYYVTSKGETTDT